MWTLTYGENYKLLHRKLTEFLKGYYKLRIKGTKTLELPEKTFLDFQPPIYRKKAEDAN